MSYRGLTCVVLLAPGRILRNQRILLCLQGLVLDTQHLGQRVSDEEHVDIHRAADERNDRMGTERETVQSTGGAINWHRQHTSCRTQWAAISESICTREQISPEPVETTCWQTQTCSMVFSWSEMTSIYCALPSPCRSNSWRRAAQYHRMSAPTHQNRLQGRALASRLRNIQTKALHQGLKLWTAPAVAELLAESSASRFQRFSARIDTHTHIRVT